MESEKVKEIKKALECCSTLMDNNATSEEQDNSCNECPYRLNDRCSWKLDGDALTLINELESENERLLAEKQKVLEYMKTDNYAKLKKEDMYWGYQMGIGMLEHEIDRLKDRIAELKEDNAKWQRKAINYYQMVKSYGIECVIDSDIDETLKEFINKGESEK